MSILNFDGPSGRNFGKPLKMVLGIGALAAVIAVASTLAANININSGPVEFGQGVAQTTACDSEIVVIPKSSFINSETETNHFFTSVEISEIDGSADKCGGKIFRVRAYSSEGLLPLYVDTRGTSDLSDDVEHDYWQGTLPVGSSSITANFPHQVDSSYGLANADLVEKITVETLPGNGTSGTLYGITGAGGDAGNLYLLSTADSLNISAQLIGALNYNGVQLTHTTGLAWDPVGQMFYIVSNSSNALYKFNPSTVSDGAIDVTLVGSLEYGNYPDLAFTSSGQLWGWSEDEDKLVKIDKSNADETVFESFVITSSTGLAVDNSDNLWLKTDGLFRLNVDSNAITSEPQYGSNLPGNRANILTVDSNGIFWTGARHEDEDSGDVWTELFTFSVNGLSEGTDDVAVTALGNLDGIALSAIEFVR